jgi:hypothetical protein
MKPLNLKIFKIKKLKTMNKYFIEILKNRTLLMIPGFGALTVANRTTGKIVFNPNLKFDDNVLVNFIVEKEGIDQAEAKNIIAKFVRELEAQLAKGESYDIYSLGKFLKNNKGEIVFEAEKDALNDSKPEEKKESIKEPTDSTKENVYVPPVVEEVKEKVTEKIDNVKKEADKSIDDLKNKFKKTTDEATEKAKKEEKNVKDNISSATSAEDLKNKFKKKNSSTKTAKAAKATKQPKQKGEKKKRSFLPWLILLLLIIGVGVGGYFYKDKVKEMLGMTKTAEHSNNDENTEIVKEDANEKFEPMSDNEAVADSTQTELDALTENENTSSDEAQNTEEIIEDENEPVIQPSVTASVNGNYHIIGGAFGEEQNAVKYAEKTGGKVLGRFNGLYQVAIKSYDSRSDANSGLSELKSEYPNAWILKYPK